MKLTEVYSRIREYVRGPEPHEHKTIDEYREEVAAEFAKRFEPLGIGLDEMPHMQIYIETIAKIRYEYQM